jgi:intraflagellar transport protein 122
VTDADWSNLGVQALEALQFDIAKNCFIRVRNLRYLELIHNILERKKLPAYIDDDEYLADIYAYQGKFSQAADLYVKTDNQQKALLMYTDLRMFGKAKAYMQPGDAQSARLLMQKQAEWSKTAKDPTVMIDILLHAGEEDQAIDLMGQSGMHQRLIEMARVTDQAETAKLQTIARWLGKMGQVPLAAEIYDRIQDEQGMVELYISNKKWTEAFALAERNQELREAIYLPYANMLAEDDKFEEAQQAFRNAGHAEKAIGVLEILTHNAVMESRYGDAGYYYWQLSMAALGDLSSIEERGESLDEARERAKLFQKKAEQYYAFDSIQRYIAEPFTSHQPDSLFNIARFLLNGVRSSVPLGISKVAVLYSLAKQSRNLGAFKLARYAYDSLQKLKVPPTFREQIDLGAISIRSKPHMDSEDVLPLCYRCSELNPLFVENVSAAAAQEGSFFPPAPQCVKCAQEFVYSFHSFEVLPLVEFELETSVEDAEAVTLIEDDSSVGKSKDTKDKGDTQVMSMGDDNGGDAFTAQFMEFTPGGSTFTPVRADREMLKSMPSNEVFVQKWPAPLPNRYFRNVLPEIAVSQCEACMHFFHSDDFELLVLQKGTCPFCRVAVDIGGNQLSKQTEA